MTGGRSGNGERRRRKTCSLPPQAVPGSLSLSASSAILGAFLSYLMFAFSCLLPVISMAVACLLFQAFSACHPTHPHHYSPHHTPTIASDCLLALLPMAGHSGMAIALYIKSLYLYSRQQQALMLQAEADFGHDMLRWDLQRDRMVVLHLLLHTAWAPSSLSQTSTICLSTHAHVAACIYYFPGTYILSTRAVFLLVAAFSYALPQDRHFCPSSGSVENFAGHETGHGLCLRHVKALWLLMAGSLCGCTLEGKRTHCSERRGLGLNRQA